MSWNESVKFTVIGEDGGDVTREITPEQVEKLKACPDCRDKPHLFIQVKKQRVSVCRRCWEKISDTVIGWKGEDPRQKELA